MIRPNQGYQAFQTEPQLVGSTLLMRFILADKVDNVIDGQAIITRRYWKSL